MRQLARILNAAALASLGLVLFACGGDSPTGATTPVQRATVDVFVSQTVQGLPIADVTIRVSGSAVSVNAARVYWAYMDTPSGYYNIQDEFGAGYFVNRVGSNRILVGGQISLRFTSSDAVNWNQRIVRVDINYTDDSGFTGDAVGRP